MKLYYADFSSMNLEELITEYTDKVDMHRQSKITRTQAPAARVRSLLAGYLLQCAVKDTLKEQRTGEMADSTGVAAKKKQEAAFQDGVMELAYSYGSQGKPYLTDYPEIFFSLSHSGNVVACIVAEQEIGLDIQEHVTVKSRLAERFFTEKENELLKAQPNEEAYRKLFFRLWSIKESYIKYTGLGMKQGLDSFEIGFGKKIIREKKKETCFEEIVLEGLPAYAISVCMEVREPVCIIKKELKGNKVQ